MRWLQIALYRLKQMLFSKYTLITMILLPMIFLYIVGSVYSPIGSGSGIPIAVVDLDNSNFSKVLISILNEEKLLEVSQVDFDTGKNMVKNNGVEGAYVIHKGFEEKLKGDKTPEIEVFKSSASYGADAIIEIVTSGVIRLQSNSRAANIVVKEYENLGLIHEDKKEKLWWEVFNKSEEYWKPRPLLELDYKSIYFETEVAEKGKWVGFNQGPTGLIITFLALFLGYGISLLLKEREEGTLKRLYLVCKSPMPIIVGNLVAMVVLGAIQITTLLLLSSKVFGITILGPIQYLSLIFVGYMVLVLGLVIFFASWSRSNQSFNNNYSLFIVVTSLLGGCFWSIDIGGETLKTISLITPQGLAMEAFKLAALGETSKVLLYFIIMIIVSIILLLMSNSRLINSTD